MTGVVRSDVLGNFLGEVGGHDESEGRGEGRWIGIN